MMSDELLSIEQVSAITGYAVGTIYHLVSRGEIPYIKLSPKALRFKASEIDAWINQRAEAERKKLEVEEEPKPAA